MEFETMWKQYVVLQVSLPRAHRHRFELISKNRRKQMDNGEFPPKEEESAPKETATSSRRQKQETPAHAGGSVTIKDEPAENHEEGLRTLLPTPTPSQQSPTPPAAISKAERDSLEIICLDDFDDDAPPPPKKQKRAVSNTP